METRRTSSIPKRSANSSKSTAARRQCNTRNTETNICNQVFSFISYRRKSEQTLMRLIGGVNPGQICELYFCYISVLSGLRRTYLNRKTLRKLCVETPNELLTRIIVSAHYDSKVLPISEFCRLTRTLVRFHLEKLCTVSILTSKKMSKYTQVEHLQRKRQIANHLFKNLLWFIPAFIWVLHPSI